MISDRCIAECFNRLSTLTFFPKEDGVRKELGKLFGKLCQDDKEARSLVDAILEAGWHGHEGVMAAHASIARARPPVNGCGLCKNTGYRGRFRIIEKKSRNPTFVFDDPDRGEFWQERDLWKSYPRPAYDVSHAQLVCKCALGQAIGEKMFAAVGQYKPPV